MANPMLKKKVNKHGIEQTTEYNNGYGIISLIFSGVWRFNYVSDIIAFSLFRKPIKICLGGVVVSWIYFGENHGWI